MDDTPSAAIGCFFLALPFATGVMAAAKLTGDLAVSWWIVLSPLALKAGLLLTYGLLERWKS